MYMVQAMGESIQGPSSPFIRDAAAAPIGHVSAYIGLLLCQPTFSDICLYWKDWTGLLTLLEDQGGF